MGSPSAVVNGGQVLAEFSFLNEVKSEDYSITVEDNSSSALPNVKVRIDIAGDSSVSSVIDIEQAATPETGKHHLKSKGENGLVRINSGLSVLTVSAAKRILVCSNGLLQWLTVPNGEAALGVKNGTWYWYSLSDCENACSIDGE